MFIVLTEYPSGSFHGPVGRRVLFLLLVWSLERIIATHLIGVEANNGKNVYRAFRKALLSCFKGA